MRLPVLIVSLAVAIAAPAAAQPADGQPFRVFFDWGKPELTRDAEATLGDVITAYQRLRPSRIEVAGHTDRSGSEAVNLAASRRRANAVKAYLSVHGIPLGAITVSAFGESRPIVATEDGVREAQNRRVEISFGGTSTISTTTTSAVSTTTTCQPYRPQAFPSSVPMAHPPVPLL